MFYSTGLEKRGFLSFFKDEKLSILARQKSVSCAMGTTPYLEQPVSDRTEEIQRMRKHKAFSKFNEKKK
ncbi:hypothetical protein AU378_09585 [Chryseobacterium kwangjuense]|uniref:Uncharacterized protein n=1 Tax=Chryseobacterium kwangjuense TaxID=267125 RepID=A0A135WM19_9FLAO|nr:hypothetical protein AU378_09585 [Chryseobacterium kwangjuense]